MQRIAIETEEDYQKLILLLEKFNVEVLRPDKEACDELAMYSIRTSKKIPKPYFMQPRDTTIMLGEEFYVGSSPIWNSIKKQIIEAGNVIKQKEILHLGTLVADYTMDNSQAFELYMNGAMTTRVGKDLYIGTFHSKQTEYINGYHQIIKNKLPNYRISIVDTEGHTDGTFCPVVPGLIISLVSEINYEKTFPGWEVVYLENEGWGKVKNWIELKKKNLGKWWVPGEELNEDFTNYVETWLNDWVGYVEESVFDVNMIVIDKKNVIVNGYNKKAFDAFSRHGITPHLCNFRHRYFWDGGLHCITSDLHREGVMEDYFPERNQ
jgi:N-dimethylarginine dimethylaminohydrolase